MGSSSPLAPLLELRGVVDALSAARTAVDTALRHPALRRAGGRLVAEVGLRAAVASASLEGHPFEVPDVRAGAVTDPVLQGAVRVSAELPGLAQRWTGAPRQVLARLHLLAGKGVVESLGQPVQGVERLNVLCELIARPDGMPALLRAAVVHGELLALHPFEGPNGVVARAAARLTLMAEGFDPRGLIAPEIGHLAREPEYVGSANAFATGTPDGLRSWLSHSAAAMQAGAAELVALADAAA